MKERKDLRDLIIPTVITNTNQEGKKGNRQFNTTDKIFIDADKDLDGLTKEERKVVLTDYALMRRKC